MLLKTRFDSLRVIKKNFFRLTIQKTKISHNSRGFYTLHYNRQVVIVRSNSSDMTRLSTWRGFESRSQHKVLEKS